MNMLTDQIGTVLRYRNRNYNVCCSFDVVLEVQRMYKDDRLTDMDKVNQALSMLTTNKVKVWALHPEQKVELLNQVIREHIELPKRPQSGRQTKTVDFALDGDFIYASFMQAYDIDLMEHQGKLHWKKFIALFQGLPDGTKIKEVMRIRGMDVPAPTKYNSKELQNITELKSYYALPVEGGGGEHGLDALFGALERMATS